MSKEQSTKVSTPTAVATAPTPEIDTSYFTTIATSAAASTTFRSAELVVEAAALPLSSDSSLAEDLQKHREKSLRGRIKIGAKGMSGPVIKITALVLIALTVYGFITFDYKNIDFFTAVAKTLHNVRVMFTQPHLVYNSFPGLMWALLVTFALGALATFFGAIVGFFGALLCAKNLANPIVGNIVRAIVAFIRAVPTVLWVLIFSVAAGLGSVAAVVGLTFHSAGYLVKAYSESIEEIDYGTIEALKASGAKYWQIIFQAVVPASIGYLTAWTFLRFEINFANAIAIGAAAGAGGIGYDLFMASAFYFDLSELGFITYTVIIAVVILEIVATRIKAKVR
ncbi:MAG: ABC transporter permease subunit [Coriobacteriia bacterium]|nr:ABC transporter permease subunit [Coriobacteriia bacterium]